MLSCLKTQQTDLSRGNLPWTELPDLPCLHIKTRSHCCKHSCGYLCTAPVSHHLSFTSLDATIMCTSMYISKDVNSLQNFSNNLEEHLLLMKFNWFIKNVLIITGLCITETEKPKTVHAHIKAKFNAIKCTLIYYLFDTGTSHCIMFEAFPPFLELLGLCPWLLAWKGGTAEMHENKIFWSEQIIWDQIHTPGRITEICVVWKLEEKALQQLS